MRCPGDLVRGILVLLDVRLVPTWRERRRFRGAIDPILIRRLGVPEVEQAVSPLHRSLFYIRDCLSGRKARLIMRMLLTAPAGPTTSNERL
jgi:hypothetical protein